MKPTTAPELVTSAPDDEIRRKPGKTPGGGALTIDSALLKDVNVVLQAGLGQTSISIEELLALKPGSVVRLDLMVNDLVELRLNDSLVARGEIVAVDDNFGVRIVELAPK